MLTRRVVRAAKVYRAPCGALPRVVGLPSSVALPRASAGKIVGARPYATGTAEIDLKDGGVPKSSVFAPLDTFTRRHVGPQPSSVATMLDALGYDSLDAFVDACVPPSIRISDKQVSEEGNAAIHALSEQELLRRARQLADKNKVTRSFIGMGYHQAVLPPVILRNMLENHSWFSQYTAYQVPLPSRATLETGKELTRLQGRDLAGPARIAHQLPELDDLAHWSRHCERIAP